MKYEVVITYPLGIVSRLQVRNRGSWSKRVADKEAENGTVRVNNLASYTEWHRQNHADYLAGRHDHTFTFRQRAHYIQTGECLPLLP